jgi:CheY-like chemotaxis protein
MGDTAMKEQSKRKILVVDDESRIRALVRMLLGKPRLRGV